MQKFLLEKAKSDIFEAITSLDCKRLVLAKNIITSLKDSGIDLSLNDLEQKLLCNYALYSLNTNLTNLVESVRDHEARILDPQKFYEGINGFFTILLYLVSLNNLSSTFKETFYTIKKNCSGPLIIQSMIDSGIYYSNVDNLKVLVSNPLYNKLQYLAEKNDVNFAALEKENISKKIKKSPTNRKKTKI